MGFTPHKRAVPSVPKVGHRFAQLHPRNLRPLRPGVAIAVQTDGRESKPVSPLAEPRGPHLVVLLRQLRKQVASIQ